ncbi:MAG: glycosyltransferase family 2 protein [Pirellulaceae bacterium]
MNDFELADHDLPREIQRLRAALVELAPELAAEDSDAARAVWLERILGTALCRKLGIYVVPEDFKLSVVIPVFNELRTLERVIDRVRATRLPLEIVIVDDGSRDGTRDLLAGWRDASDPRHADLKIIFHEHNLGKGGAVRTGFQHCTGNVVVIQDADLEYDPQDLRSLLQPIVEGQADVVYGSRFSHVDGQVHHYWHRWGNQLITRLSNWKSGRTLTDVETCYKVIRRELIEQIAPGLRERGFGIELELTFKLARLPNVRFYERPISYYGRSYSEGKKITWRDGLWALWCICRY